MARTKDQADGTAFVIFGISGDLAHRKLIPALYALVAQDFLPGPLYLVGMARRKWNGDSLRDEFHKSLNETLEGQPLDEDAFQSLFHGACYVSADFNDPQGFARLKETLESLPVKNVLYYLSTPPEVYETIIEQLGAHQLDKALPGWSRIVVEKPYGEDLDSALDLDRKIHRVFSEDQIYRIDHYLGKDTVQNILVLRFANAIFEPLWNNHYIDHVQIMVAESIGVGSRINYYDSAGVIRDIFQNHLLQLLCLVAMEVPVAFQSNSVRDEKIKVLDVLRPMRGKTAIQNTFRAQYGAGKVDGERVKGYVDEVGHATTTETYMAARVYLDNWRWAGVPFYLRSGKRLPERLTQISVHFKAAPIFLFDWCNITGEAPNRLVFNIQPDEGINLSFGAKIPGQTDQITPVAMQFDYKTTFGQEPPEAYQRLLLDALNGDPMLFTRSDEVRAAWTFTTRILDAWREQELKKLPEYPAGSWGPKGTEDLIRRDGREWFQSTGEQENCD